MVFALKSVNTLSTRVVARISEMPVQNSYHKISACADLATQLLQILLPTTFYSLFYQKGQFTLKLCLRSWIVMERYDY